jgi:hypothetical protein
MEPQGDDWQVLQGTDEAPQLSAYSSAIACIK